MLPLVLVPGIQGRWEYMQPTIDALSARFRVITLALGDPATGHADVDAVLSAMDDAEVHRAVLCGVSYGGTVAARVAARAPERTLALVLASTPAPGWHLRPRHRLYARLPWLFGPLFLIETPWRLRREIAVAIPDRRARFAFKRKALATALRTGLSFSQMAARALLLHQLNLAEACARISAPTLVVTGEAALDHVVPTSQSSDWVRLIARATPAVLAETGHIGTMTRPREFAALVADFVAREVGQATSSGDSHHAA